MRIFPFPTADVDIDHFVLRASRVGPDQWMFQLETDGLDRHTEHQVFNEYLAQVTRVDVWSVWSVLERTRVLWYRPEPGPF